MIGHWGCSVGDLAVQPASGALTAHEAIDALETAMFKRPQVDCPLVHSFTPGMYIRHRTVPADTLLTSMIHKTEHPYAMLAGRARIWDEVNGWLEVEAPFNGITQVGTRRVVAAITPVVWMTFHPNPDDERRIEVLEERLFSKSFPHQQFIESCKKEPQPCLV